MWGADHGTHTAAAAVLAERTVIQPQRQQLLYETDYGANRHRFADSDATLRECAAMVGYVFD